MKTRSSATLPALCLAVGALVPPDAPAAAPQAETVTLSNRLGREMHGGGTLEPPGERTHLEMTLIGRR